MLIELPSLADHIYQPENWGFHKEEKQQKGFVTDFRTPSMTIVFQEESLDHVRNEKYNVIVKIGSKEVNGIFVVKGKWRYAIPSGLLYYEFNQVTFKHFVVFEGGEYNSPQKREKYSEFSCAELFDGEVFNYKLIEAITSNSLSSHVLQVMLVLGSSRIYTRALFIEFFEHSEICAFSRESTTSSYKVSAADILNLYFLQALIANQDYHFDYNEQGIFICHNVAGIAKNHKIIPIPYDFQFTGILTPYYQKHRNSNLHNEACLNANYIAQKLYRIPPHVSVSHIFECYEIAIKLLSKIVSSDRLRGRYVNYLNLFYSALRN